MKTVLFNEEGVVDAVYDGENAADFLPQDMTLSVDEETGKLIADSLADKTVRRINGVFVYEDNGNAHRREVCEEIARIERWFAEYDRQTAQYQRAQRLGTEYDNRYGTITELDAQAEGYAVQLAALRAEVAEG